MSALLPGEFSPELAAWLAQADGKISVDPRRWPGAFVSLLGGDPVPRFRTPSLDVVERFLANEAGSSGRFLAGLPDDVVVPFELADLPPGAALRTLTDGPLGGFEELSVDGIVIGAFGFGPSGRLAHSSAVKASHYGPATVATIAQSYLSADGSPLFTLRERRGR